MKRRAELGASHGRQKKPRTKGTGGPQSTAYRPVHEYSLYNESKEFLLGTARFPVDALTPRWSLGENRSISPAHVKQLCKLFNDQGLRRSDAECYIRVGCTRQQFQNMLAHVRSQQLEASLEETDEGGDGLWFRDWEVVNGCKAELLAGNHRVEALKRLLKGSCEADRWWTAQIYDIGTWRGPQSRGINLG